MIEPKIRPIDQWPPGWRDANRAETRRPSPFRNSYGDTLGQLDEELGHLDATEWHLQLDVQPGHLRRDGQLRADADVRHPGVILTVVTAAHTVVLKDPTGSCPPGTGPRTGTPTSEQRSSV